MKSNIETLPGIHWSPKALFADIKGEIDDMEDVFIMYHKKGEEPIYWVAAGLKISDVLWMMTNHIHQMMDENHGE